MVRPIPKSSKKLPAVVLSLGMANPLRRGRRRKVSEASGHLQRSRYHLAVPQAVNLGFAQTQVAAQNFVGVLAQQRGPPWCIAWHRTEGDRRSRNPVAADARLVELGEKTVGQRATRILFHHLTERLIGAPAHPG